MTNRICGWPFQNAPKGSNCVKYGSTYWFFETNSRILEMGRRRRKSRSGRAVVPKPSQTRSVGIWRRFFAGNGNARQQMRALGTDEQSFAGNSLGHKPESPSPPISRPQIFPGCQRRCGWRFGQRYPGSHQETKSIERIALRLATGREEGSARPLS
jgi:hypothetical protein